MASPQTENGYTKIANEIFDAMLQWHFSSYEFRVLIFIIRKTYGWKKKEDRISLSQFVEATGIRESHISRALGMLIKQNIIVKTGTHNFPKFGLQKDYEKWKQLPKGVRAHHPVKRGKSRKAVTKGGISLLPKGGDTKETITKEINTEAEASPSKNMKANKIGRYNEESSSDSYEEAIDLDTGEIQEPVVKKSQKTVASQKEAYQKSPYPHKRVLWWYYEQRGMWDTFENVGQISVNDYRHAQDAKRIADANFSEEKIDAAYKAMLKNERVKDEWTLGTLIKYLTK